MAGPSIDIKITTTRDLIKTVLASINKLTATQVMVGIPAENAPREGEPINNATLGYIHENGAPERNIPARPFLVPGVTDRKDQIADYLGQGAKAALQGKPELAERALMAAGQEGETGAVSRILAGIPPPLSPKTIYNRQHRRVNRRTASETTPLVDTGELKNSITHVLRKVTR